MRWSKFLVLLMFLALCLAGCKKEEEKRLATDDLNDLIREMRIQREAEAARLAEREAQKKKQSGDSSEDSTPGVYQHQSAAPETQTATVQSGVVGAKTTAPVTKESALEIVTKSRNLNEGRDSTAKVEMTLYDRGGSGQTRVFDVQSKTFGTLRKRYLRFTSPASIQGTAFLTLERAGDTDEQFLFLPSVGRSRRIVASQRDKSFVNSEFTYEDMERIDPATYKHKLLRSEPCGTQHCWVVESIPNKAGASQYSKRLNWVNQQNYMLIRADLYKGARVAKRLSTLRHEKVDGVWTAMDIEMKDLSSGRRTVTNIKSIRYNQGVDDRIFTAYYLEQANK